MGFIGSGLGLALFFGVFLIFKWINILNEYERGVIFRLGRVLDEVGMTEHADRSMGTYSKGMQQRLAIGQALTAKPRILLLDEPFAGIDPIAVLDLQRIIAHLKSLGIGVLITDHNVRETLKITDRAYIIKDGKIFATGHPVDLAGNEDVRRIYLGEDFQL